MDSYICQCAFYNLKVQLKFTVSFPNRLINILPPWFSEIYQSVGWTAFAIPKFFLLPSCCHCCHSSACDKLHGYPRYFNISYSMFAISKISLLLLLVFTNSLHVAVWNLLEYSKWLVRSFVCIGCGFFFSVWWHPSFPEVECDIRVIYSLRLVLTKNPDSFLNLKYLLTFLIAIQFIFLRSPLSTYQPVFFNMLLNPNNINSHQFRLKKAAYCCVKQTVSFFFFYPHIFSKERYWFMTMVNDNNLYIR